MIAAPLSLATTRLEQVRERTLELYEPIDAELAAWAPRPFMSPPQWDLGHIAAYEELWLVGKLTGRPSLHPELQAAYDAFETPRRVRTEIPILGLAACRDYLDAVREMALDALAGADLSDDAGPLTRGGMVAGLVAQHEAQHCETVLQTLQLYPAGVYRPAGRTATPDAAVATPGPPWVEVPGATFPMGAGDAGFAYDCERPRHERAVDGFLLGRHPVTNGAHLEFMADGGYRRRELWSAEGWRWREENGVEAPLYWRRGDGGWVVDGFMGGAPVDPRLPVCHVSFHEADAHARWAGARLPTEEEWELAAAWDGRRHRPMPWGDAPAEGRATLGQATFAPAPAGAYPQGAAPCGAEQMAGDVWEWTSTRFDGYPGFRAFPYREYAEVFFGGDYRVLRGGSWATNAVACRTTFRNWDHPYRRQIFAGFRLARDGAA